MDEWKVRAGWMTSGIIDHGCIDRRMMDGWRMINAWIDDDGWMDG